MRAPASNSSRGTGPEGATTRTTSRGARRGGRAIVVVVIPWIGRDRSALAAAALVALARAVAHGRQLGGGSGVDEAAHLDLHRTAGAVQAVVDGHRFGHRLAVVLHRGHG